MGNPMIIKDTRTQQKNVDQNIVYIFDLLILLKIQFCSKLLLGLIRDFIITKTNQNEYQRKKEEEEKINKTDDELNSLSFSHCQLSAACFNCTLQRFLNSHIFNFEIQ